MHLDLDFKSKIWMVLKWPTGATREEVQRHENLKITLIFDCMIVLGAEFYVPNGA